MKFIDTSFWVALLLARDRRHPEARALWQSDLGPLLSTNHVVGETWTFLRRKDGHRTAIAFLDRIDALQQQSKLALHRVTVNQEDKAWAWLRKHDERTYSFVDATSFQVMRDRRLREALAFDQDFAAVGFIELRP